MYQTQQTSTCIRFLLFQDCRYSYTPTSTDPRVGMSFYFLLLTFQAQRGSQVLPHYPVPLRYHLCSLSWNLFHLIFIFLAYKSTQFTTTFSEKKKSVAFLPEPSSSSPAHTGDCKDLLLSYLKKYCGGKKPRPTCIIAYHAIVSYCWQSLSKKNQVM